MAFRVIDTDTGQVVTTDAACPSCALHRARLEATDTDLANAERELRKLRRNLTRLENELTHQRQIQRDGAVIAEIADYWREVCNHPRAVVEVEGERAGKVWARIKGGHSVEQIKRAIRGAGAYPYQRYAERFKEQQPNSIRRDDLAFICASDARIELLCEYANKDQRYLQSEPPPGPADPPMHPDHRPVS